MNIAPDFYRFRGHGPTTPSTGPMRLRCPQCGGRAHVRIGVRNAVRRAIASGATSRASGCAMCPGCQLAFGISIQVEADDYTPGAPTEVEWDLDGDAEGY